MNFDRAKKNTKCNLSAKKNKWCNLSAKKNKWCNLSTAKTISKTPLVLCLLFLIICLAPTVRSAKADSGPKPFVSITFKNLPNGECYATLLSKSENSGPHRYDYSPFTQTDGDGEFYYSSEQRAIDDKFSAYIDSDGYYYLHFYRHVEEGDMFKWGYYPPKQFKILLYNSADDTFIASDEILSRYAFSSYFTYDLADKSTVNSYDYFGEILKLILRIVLTIGIEIGIALLFKYRNRQLILIVITNVVTQILLNVYLNLLNYRSGYLALILNYIGIEILVVIIEAITYSIGMRLIDNKTQSAHRNTFIHILYALAANVASFVLGALFLIAIGI